MNKKVDLKDIIQIGVITDSTEESNKVLETVLGWKHWGIWETTPGTGRYYYDAEEDFSCRMSFYSFGKIELEVIEPLRGRSCWRNYLSKTGGGIHHFLFNVHSASEAKKMFDSYGWTTEQQGMARPYGEKVIWAYADTEHDLDFTVEYTNRKEYPQVNPTVHPTVEGMFKTLIGVRILTEDMERVSKNYEEILGWNVEQGTDHTYGFDSLKIYLTQPREENELYREYLAKKGAGPVSLVIKVEDIGKAKQHMLSYGIAKPVWEKGNNKAIYDLGLGYMVELVVSED